MPKRGNLKKLRIVVGMSGGVDSSLAAALLKKQGHDVIGVTFRMWPKEECGAHGGRACCSLEAVTRARVVSEDLGIPYYVVDFSAEFKRHVIDYFCGEYLKGMTPNPCVVCNQKIKFGILMDKARSLGASHVATGHYARISAPAGGGRSLLKEGRDKAKDQSYFLFNLSQDQLGHILFPLGGLTKERVRVLARRMKVRTYNTVSSQDICFVQGQDYAEYIVKKTGASAAKGDIVDSSGKVLGRHKGFIFYTIGQRRGLGVAYSRPLYVTGIDVANNRIIVGVKEELMKKSLVAERVNWISREKPCGSFKAEARIRYNAKKARALITPIDGGSVRVDFAKAQSASTPGQAVVFYDRDVVIGGGWIRGAGDEQ